MNLRKVLKAIDAMTWQDRWAVRQHLAGATGRYYGDDGTIHESGYLDVEVHEGRVVSVWFRCQLLPFKEIDVEVDLGLHPAVAVRGVEVVGSR